MYKIKVRPYPHNRWLYNIDMYKQSSFLGFTYWKWYGANEAVADYNVDKFVLDIRKTHTVIKMDFLFNDVIEIYK